MVNNAIEGLKKLTQPTNHLEIYYSQLKIEKKLPLCVLVASKSKHLLSKANKSSMVVPTQKQRLQNQIELF